MTTTQPKQKKKSIGVRVRKRKDARLVITPKHATYFQTEKERGFNFEFSDDTQFVIYYIVAFEMYDGEPCIACDIDTIEGPTDDVTLFAKNCLHESFISAIRGCEKKLISMGWISRSKLKSLELPPIYTTPYLPNQILRHQPIIYCKCLGVCTCKERKYRHPIVVKIDSVHPHKYVGEIEPEYHVTPTRSTRIRPGYVVEDQLWIFKKDETVQSWVITLEDVARTTLRKAHKYKNKKYTELSLLTNAEVSLVPLDCRYESAFYLKSNLFEDKKNEIEKIKNDNINYIDTAKDVLTALLKQEFQNTKSRALTVQTAQTINTKKNVQLKGLYLSEIMMDFGLKKFLENIEITINYDDAYIYWMMNEEHICHLGLNRVIRRRRDGSQVELCSDIRINYVRKQSRIIVKKFKYETKNSIISAYESHN